MELLRPIPPLALIPLFIVWFGIGEEGKVNLLMFAAVWIMIIAARSGVLAVNTTKVHAAYSLGASKAQVLRHVILPNALPEIFTGLRVAIGVCWGTLVAAELARGQLRARLHHLQGPTVLPARSDVVGRDPHQHPRGDHGRGHAHG